MKTKDLLVSIFLLFTISVFGQQDVTKDYNNLDSLNKKFIDYEKLKLKKLKEEEIRNSLVEKYLPNSENNKEIEVYEKSIYNKEERLKKMNKNYPMYTDRAMSKMFTQYQSILSGSGLQKGAVRSLIASMDDKGLQFSYSRHLSKHNFFYNVNISGKTDEASTDGFLTIFSNNKLLNNNITYSWGGDIFWFFKGSKSFTEEERKKLHLRINDLLYEKEEKVKQLKKDYCKLTKISTEVENAILKYGKIDVIGKREISFTELQTLQENLKKLKVEGVTETDNLSDLSAITESISDFKKIGKDYYSKNKILIEADSLQIKASSAIGQHWFAFGAKYNINKLGLLDSNFPSSDTLRTRDYTNDYVSLKLSYNYFKKFRRVSLVLSPTANFSNQRNFTSDKLITSSKIQNYTINEIDYQITKDDPVQFYEKREDRVNVYSIECPTSLFVKNWKFGFDLNFKLGVNDPNDNNVSAKVGIYVPIRDSENKIINIEPLIRFVKLFSSGQNNFIKDNVQFGFILAVSLPPYTKI